MSGQKDKTRVFVVFGVDKDEQSTTQPLCFSMKLCLQRTQTKILVDARSGTQHSIFLFVCVCVGGGADEGSWLEQGTATLFCQS